MTERSVVLRSAFAVSAVALAGGIGATTALPAPLVLAGFAGRGARACGSTRWPRAGPRSRGWRRCSPSSTTSPSRARAPSSAWAWPVSSPVRRRSPRASPRAVVLAIVGRRRHDVGLVLLGVAVGAVGAIASWTGATARRHRDPHRARLGVPARRAGRLRHPRGRVLEHPDRDRRPRRGVVRRRRRARRDHPDPRRPQLSDTSTEAALATLVLGAGWLVADRRRGSRGLLFGAVATAICVASAVASATANDGVLSHHADRHRRPGRRQRSPGGLDHRRARRHLGARRGGGRRSAR